MENYNRSNTAEEEEAGPLLEQEVEEEVGSSLTQERVAATKLVIENHYKSHMRHIRQRRERRFEMGKQLASAEVSEEEQMNLLKDLEYKETGYI